MPLFYKIIFKLMFFGDDKKLNFKFKDSLYSSTTLTQKSFSNSNKMFPCSIYKINLDFLVEKSSYEIKFNQLCENSSRTIKRELNYENLNSQFIYTSELPISNAPFKTDSQDLSKIDKNSSDSTELKNVSSTSSVAFNSLCSNSDVKHMVSNVNRKIYQKIISSNKV